MRKFEIVDEIGKGCGLSVIAATCALTFSLTVLPFNPSKEIRDACRRVVPTALVITAVGLLGVLWSDRTCSRMAAETIERIEEARWESLKRVVKGRGYSIASCRDCKHLVGQLGNDNVLICAMHPYGWKGWDCPDKENKDGLR